MYRGKIRRERRDMMIVLPRIIREGLSALFATRPREIEVMFQEMFRRDVFIYFVEMFVHHFSPDKFSATD